MKAVSKIVKYQNDPRRAHEHHKNKTKVRVAQFTNAWWLFSYAQPHQLASFRFNLQYVNDVLQLVNSLLQAVNDVLQLVNSLLQVVNDLLQVVNDLLQLVNSLLQVVNDVLQLVNSLLQVVNDSLQVVNSLLQIVNDLLRSVNDLLRHVLASVARSMQEKFSVIEWLSRIARSHFSS